MSCATNIITANLANGSPVTTAPLYQWDYGQVLRFSGVTLPYAFTVHFSNQPIKGTAQGAVASDGQVTIPANYLTSGANVYAWIFLHEGETDGETEYAITIPVIRRAQPTDETPTPEQQSEIDQAIAALNAAVTVSEGYAEAAEESASNASESAGNALQHARDAEAWAVGERGGEPVPDTDETYQNNSKYWAERSEASAGDASGFAGDAENSAGEASDSATAASGFADEADRSARAAAESVTEAESAADRAEQAAASAGYMFFGIDSRGHVILDKTPNVPVDFELVNGHLIVEAV